MNTPAFPCPDFLPAGSPLRAYFFGLTKRELLTLELAKAWRIAHPDFSSTDIAEAAEQDANALFARLTT